MRFLKTFSVYWNMQEKYKINKRERLKMSCRSYEQWSLWYMLFGATWWSYPRLRNQEFISSIKNNRDQECTVAMKSNSNQTSSASLPLMFVSWPTQYLLSSGPEILNLPDATKTEIISITVHLFPPPECGKQYKLLWIWILKVSSTIWNSSTTNRSKTDFPSLYFWLFSWAVSWKIKAYVCKCSKIDYN